MKIIMNKVIPIFILLAMLFAFTACNTNKKESNKASASAEPKDKVDKTDKNGNEKENEKDTEKEEGPFKNSDKKRVKAKGLYLTATSAGIRLEHYIELANTTEINSYVIDYKEDSGIICTNSNVALAKDNDCIEVRYDAKKVTTALRENNIYSIARIVCFKDPKLAGKQTDLAIKNSDGSLYKSRTEGSIPFLNPYDQRNWKYFVDLAKEAYAAGFDEVQFDYIRFPNGDKSKMNFGDTKGKSMSDTINEFLRYARKEMPDQIIAGDVFAIICESPNDTEKIGQDFELIGESIDYVCPMSYPSHYALGQIINGVKFPKPDLDPYNLIKNTFLKAKKRLEASKVHKPLVRAYLQDFTATWIGSGNWQYYEDEQIRQQIKGLYDAGYEEWFLWDPQNKYREGAFEKE